MKSSLLLPFKYILTVVILLVLFTLFKLFPLWGPTFDPATGGMTYSHTREVLPHLLAEVFIPAATLGVFLSYMRSPLNKRSRFFRFLLMLITSFFVLAGGFSLVLRYTPEYKPVSSKSPALLEGSLNPLSESYLYPQRVSNGSLSGIVVCNRTAYHTDNDAPFFQYYRRGKIDGETGKVIFPEDNKTITLDPPNPFFSAVFAPPNFLVSFSEDLNLLTLKVRSLSGESRRSFLFYCFVISFFCASCGTVARITRWPLFNIFGLFFMFRALFYLYRVFSEEAGTEIVGLISGKLGSAQLPVTILMLIAGILVIWDILFITGQRKKGHHRYG